MFPALWGIGFRVSVRSFHQTKTRYGTPKCELLLLQFARGRDLYHGAFDGCVPQFGRIEPSSLH